MRKSATALLAIAFAFTLIVGDAHATQRITLSDSQSGVTLLDQDRDGLTLRLEVGEVMLTEVATKEGDFIVLSVENFSRSHQIGEPNLPMANKLLSIPFGCELQTTIIESEYEEFSLADYGITLPLIPVQPSLSKSDDPDLVPFEYDRDLYEQQGWYSLPLAESKVKGTMRNVHLGQVYTCPFEYNPTENKLRIYTRVDVKIDYLNADWAKTEYMHSEYYSPVFTPAYNRIINYDEALYSSGKDDLVKYPIRYVIVSDPMFEAQLQPFIAWKVKKGFNVVVGYTDVIGTSQSAIKSWIQDLYSEPGVKPSFVLFVGDDQQIQAWSGSAGGHITDMKFVEFTGDWFPEIYFGRFSAQNTTLLQPQIDKTLEYEQYLMPDPSYLGEVTLVAGVDASHAPTWGNGQINYGTDYYFNLAHGIDPHVWLDPECEEPGASAAIIQTVNDGIGFYNYSAHCGHTGMGNPSFTTTHIQNLTNDHMWLLAIGNCCLPNTFGDDYSTPCFGEVWLQEPNKGGIGFIGATDGTYWDEDYWWGVGYGPVSANPTYEGTGLGAFDGIFHDHGEPVTDHYVTNYAIAYCGNLAVTESGSSREQYYWEIYHLMGDPSVMTYMGVPSVNPVTHPSEFFMTATTVSVSADPGSYVGISIDGELKGAAYIDASGTVDVPITEFTDPGTADIVVSCQNRQPYISTINVITPSGPYVIYDYNDINDLSGNNNGELDAGESIMLGVQLKNIGPDMAYSVDATLITADGNVLLTDDTESYGDIPGNDGTAYSADAFSFDISSDAPDGHVITFDLDITGTAKDLWQSQFNMTIHAPVVTQFAVTIDDATGNNNGILDPGETANITVTLENSGSGQAGNVSGLLSESDQYLSISDDAVVFGTIAPDGGTADGAGDVFTVSADENAPMGYDVVMQLDLTGDLGYSETMNLMITIGDRVAFFYDDFAFDQGWTGLGGTAEWEMGPAVSSTNDPGLDHSPTEDNEVLGNDIGGDYNNYISGTQWITSPNIDCSDYTGVEVRYWHWTGVESSSYDHAYFQVWDGGAWITLWENGSTFQETSWNEDLYDLSVYADYNPEFKIRFGLGGTNSSGTYGGWNIDDIEIKGYFQGSGGTPAMQIEPAVFVDSLIEGEVVQRTIRVRSTGDGTLRVRFSPGDPWLSCNTDNYYISPDDSMDFEFTIDTDGMNPGMHVGSLQYTTNIPGSMTGNVPINIYIHPPVFEVQQTSVNVNVDPGEQVTSPLVIINNGFGLLHFEVGVTMFDKQWATIPGGKSMLGDGLALSGIREPIGYRAGDSDKGEVEEPYYAPVDKGSGGPDNYGYTWIDSDEPGGPTYEWIDISTVGTEVVLDDDNWVGPVTMGIMFPFYESAFNEIFINSNGYLTFGQGYSTTQNSNLPYAPEPNNLIAMWWDDLDPPEAGNVYYYHDAANNRFIVSFEGIRNYEYPTGTGSLTFQAILYQTGRIVLQYSVMDPGDDNAGLAGSTVGIENAVGDDGLAAVYNATYMHDYLAIQFSNSSWLSAGPESGTVAPFSSDTIDVLCNAGDLDDGVYTGQVGILSNDPLNPEELIPVTMTIGGSANQPPVIVEIGPQTIMETENLNLLVEASDPNGTTPSLRAENMPPTNASFLDNGDGTGTFDFTPDETQAGEYTVRFIASDTELEDTLDVLITVEELLLIGDCDGSGEIDIDDAIYLIAYIFSSGPPPSPLEVGDVDCSGEVDIDDVVYLINYIFGGGPPPCEDPPLAVPAEPTGRTGNTMK